jgi:hypothetical protein
MNRFSPYSLVIFGIITLAILGDLLLPGYVLTLDMVWVSELHLGWNTDSFNNAFPLYTLLFLLATILPAWVVQKMVLATIIFLVLWLPYRLLPCITNETGRVFAGLIYALNPFVYSRLLAGQWIVLLGYALLPLVLYAVVRLCRERDRRSALILAGSLLLMGAISIHYFYIATLLCAVWLGGEGVRLLLRRQWEAARSLAWRSALVAGMVLVVSSYWLIPGLLRETPIEARFDTTHFEAFATSANLLVSAPLNLLALGGFWGEGMDWRYHFVWPQDTAFFWLGMIGLWCLVGLGWWQLAKRQDTRFVALLLAGIGIGSYVLGLGVAHSPFLDLNLWLYEHFPGWRGLRDSHKLAGVLALVYALLAGAAAAYVRQRRWYQPALILPLMAGIPLATGLFLWGGAHGQLSPTWYPASWHQVEATLDAAPPGEKMLVLPWRGYFSLPFADQRVVANPTSRFFGPERVYSGRSVEVGDIYDQEVDPSYRALDQVVTAPQTLGTPALTTFLADRDIRFLLVIKNDHMPADEAWLTPRRQGTSSSDVTVLNALLRPPHQTLIDTEELTLYRYDTP